MRRCLNDDTIRHFAADDCDPATAAAVEAHLLACRRCAKKLASEGSGEKLLGDIRDALRSRDESEEFRRDIEAVERRLSTTLFGSRE